MCWTQPYTRHRRRQTRQITQQYMCWIQPHIVLCYLSCLSSSCFLCIVVSNTYCIIVFVLHRTTTNKTNNTTLYVLDTTYTRFWTTTNKTNNTTQYVLDTTINKTQTTTSKANNTTLYVLECPTHIVLYYLSCLSSSRVLCMVVSNTYSVVLFVLFVVVQSLVHGCVQHI
jgi:hypothetical protein